MKKSISLKIRKSDVERVGVVRVNDEILSKLEIEEGDRVTVSKDEEAVIRKAFGDSSVKKDEIFLRPTAREKLEVNDGDIVDIEKYETVGESVKEDLGDIKTKLGAGIDKIKEKFKKEEDE